MAHVIVVPVVSDHVIDDGMDPRVHLPCCSQGLAAEQPRQPRRREQVDEIEPSEEPERLRLLHLLEVRLPLRAPGVDDGPGDDVVQQVMPLPP